MRIQLRRGTTAFWVGENPTLFPGEPGVELNPGQVAKFKIGDGRTPWNELAYSGYIPGDPDEPVTDEALLAHINDTTPHPVYDDGPSLVLLYQNAKV